MGTTRHNSRRRGDCATIAIAVVGTLYCDVASASAPAIVAPFVIGSSAGEDANGAAPSDRSSASPTIEVTFDPAATGLKIVEVEEALTAYLADTGLTLDVHPGTSPPVLTKGTTTRVWLTRQEGDLQIHIWLPGDNTPSSRILPNSGDPGLLIEELGIVVRGVVRSGADSPPAPSSPTQEPMPARSELPFAVWDLRAGYRGDTFARQIRWHHGVELGAGLRLNEHAIAELSVAWIPPQREGGVAVQRVPINLGAGVRLRADARIRIAFLGVLTAEAVGWSGAAPGYTSAPGWTPRLGLGAAVDLRVGLSRTMFVYTRATARGWPLDIDLVVETSEGPQALAQSPGVSVSATVGLGARLFFIRNRPATATGRSNRDD